MNISKIRKRKTGVRKVISLIWRAGSTCSLIKIKERGSAACANEYGNQWNLFLLRCFPVGFNDMGSSGASSVCLLWFL